MSKYIIILNKWNNTVHVKFNNISWTLFWGSEYTFVSIFSSLLWHSIAWLEQNLFTVALLVL